MELSNVSESELQGIDAGRGIQDAFKYAAVGFGFGTTVGTPFGGIGGAIGGALGAIAGFFGGLFS